ncbi:MAG: YncE family protein [Mycobacteriales bacterium]
MRVRAAAISAAVFALALIGGGSASASSVLPLTGYSHMVVDGPHGHVFVTGKSTDSAIAVMNTDGTPAGTITGETGAGGMVLSGSTLYVARCGANEIDEIDTTTLTKSGSFTAAVGGTCDLALAGGRLWYSNAAGAQALGHLVSVSVDSSHAEIDSGLNLYGMIFATTPVHPDWLVVGESGLNAPPVLLEDVSNPASVTQLGETPGVDNVNDVAATPDGSTLLLADPSDWHVSSYALPSMEKSTVYPTDAYPNSVAVSPSGGQIAGGSDSTLSTDVWVFNTGNTTSQARTDFGSAENLLPRGLAFSPDGTEVYAVTAPTSGVPTFRVTSTVSLPPGSITIKRSAGHVVFGKGVTLTAHLATSTTSRSVTIYRKTAGSTNWAVAHTGTAGAGGNLTFVVHPTRKTSYYAGWNGDATHGITKSTVVVVTVTPVVHLQTKGGYSTVAGVRRYHYTAGCGKAAHTGCPTFLAWPAPLQPGRALSFVVQSRSGTGAWRTALKGSDIVGPNGKLQLTVFYVGRGIVGLSDRIRFSVAKSDAFLAATSSWKPFRVTN